MLCQKLEKQAKHRLLIGREVALMDAIVGRAVRRGQVNGVMNNYE